MLLILIYIFATFFDVAYGSVIKSASAAQSRTVAFVGKIHALIYCC